MDILPNWVSYSFPSWAATPSAQAWLFGFIFGAAVRIIRFALRSFKRSASETIQ